MRPTVAILVCLCICLAVGAVHAAPESDPGSCDFYENWLEKKLPCGSRGYALDYGRYYCRRFAAKVDRFSTTGAIWMVETRECLQASLRDLIENREARRPLRCEELREAAIDSHLSCYIDGSVSFCDLPARDLYQLLGVLEAKDALSREGLRQVKKFVHFCLLRRRNLVSTTAGAEEADDVRALEALLMVEEPER